jgi:hypothetical protein
MLMFEDLLLGFVSALSVWLLLRQGFFREDVTALSNRLSVLEHESEMRQRQGAASHSFRQE